MQIDQVRSIPWEGVSVNVYPEAKRGLVFIMAPVFSPAINADNAIDVRAVDNNVIIRFHTYPKGLARHAAKEMTSLIKSQMKLGKAQSIYKGGLPVSELAMVPMQLAYVHMSVVGNSTIGAAPWELTAPPGGVLRLNRPQAVTWSCNDQQSAHSLAEAIRAGNVSCRLEFGPKAKGLQGVNISVTASDIRVDDWKTRINPKLNSTMDPFHENQRFTADQVADIVTRASKRILTRIRVDKGSSLGDINVADIATNLMEKAMELDIVPWDEIYKFSGLYVGKGSFDPDRIKTELSTAQEITVAGIADFE